MPNNTPLPKQSGKEIGKSGTFIFNGIITREEYNRLLIGQSALKQYDIMRRSDSTIRSALQVCKLPLIGATWTVKPVQIDEDDAQYQTKQDTADYKARYLNKQLFNGKIKFKNVLRSLLTALDFGFDVEEIILEIVEFEGQMLVGIQKIAKRKQTTIQYWNMGGDSEPGSGITQQLYNEQIHIPIEKLLVMTHDQEGDNYEGISLLRYVYKDWDIKDKLTVVNAVALEKQAIAIPKIMAKAGVTSVSATDKDEAIETASNIRANEQAYIYTPQSLDIEFMDMKGSTTKEILPTISHHDASIFSSILAGFMNIGGAKGSGSQALAKDLTSLFMKSEEALADMLIEAIQGQLIQRLCDYNWSDMSEGYPQLTVSDISDDDKDTVAASLAALAHEQLITPDADVEDNLRTRFSLPSMSSEMREKYDELHAAPVAAPASTPSATKADPELTKQTAKQKQEASLISDAKDLQRRIIAVTFED